MADSKKSAKQKKVRLLRTLKRLKKANKKDDKTEEDKKESTETNNDAKDDDNNETKTKLESKKSLGAKSSNSKGQSDEESGSDDESKSKTKTTLKTGKSHTKTGQSGTSEAEGEGDNDSGDDSPSRPLSTKSKNKSIRFSIVGGARHKTETGKFDMGGSKRTLDLIPEEKDANGDPRMLKPGNPISAEKERLEQELKRLTSKTAEDCHEDIMNILELHDPQKYRKKVKGVLVVPFAMKDFYYRIAKDDNYSDKRSRLSASEIKAKVDEMKLRREHEKLIREKQAEKAKKLLEEDQIK